jgi:nickel/cobalt transporter (NicO) family protein
VTSLPDIPRPADADSPRRGAAATLLVALGAVLAAGVAMALLAWAAGLTGGPVHAAKNPFGTGLQEAGAPGNALAAWVLAVQSAFNQRLVAAVKAFSASSGGAWTLMALGFSYGVFHAAGPGHGKAVISAWILAQEKALRRGVLLSFAAAMLQAVVAVALVTALAGLLRVTAGRMTQVAGIVETASFAAVALVGAALLWRKAGQLARRLRPGAEQEACGADCGHVHAIGPREGSGSWQEAAGVVVAAGIRPCSGAIILLVFALAQGVFAAGVAATFAMALGTALTTGALACLSVFAKASALRLASGRGQGAELAILGIEVLAAAFVAVLGVALVAGVAPAAGLS